jgi:hypothetical protein
VIKDYEQKSGSDFHEFFSSFSTDTVVCIVFVLSIFYANQQSDRVTEVVDAKDLYLKAEVERDICIEILKGLHEYEQKKLGIELGDSVLKFLRA